MSDDIKNNLLSSSAWLRILLMIIYAVFAWVTGFVIIFLIIVQALCNLIMGKNNQQVQDVSSVAIDYFSQILAFMSYCSEDKPAPFSSNDKAQPNEGAAVEGKTVQESEPEEPVSASKASDDLSDSEDDVFADISFTAQDDSEDPDDDTKPQGAA